VGRKVLAIAVNQANGAVSAQTKKRRIVSDIPAEIRGGVGLDVIIQRSIRAARGALPTALNAVLT